MARLMMTGRTGLAALALLAVAACGRSEAPQTTTSSGNSEELAPVDVANAAAYTEWLKKNEIARTEVDFGSGTRAAAGSDAAMWALLPRGDVRLESLTTWRLEIDMENVEPGGYLEFRQGRKVLHRDSTPFQPSGRFVEGALPAAVVKSLKAGEKVTWGVVYEGAKELNATAEFKVVKKPEVLKQVERLEGNRINARQSPELRQLARNQILVNNGLFGEALRGSMDLAAAGKATDPFVGEAFYKIVECMRRLDLEEAPLYEAAKKLATAQTGGSSASANGGLGGTGPGGATLGGARSGEGRGGLSFTWHGPKVTTSLEKDPIGDPVAPIKPLATNTEQPQPTTETETEPATDDVAEPETTTTETPTGPKDRWEELAQTAAQDIANAESAMKAGHAQLDQAMARMAQAQTHVDAAKAEQATAKAAYDAAPAGPAGDAARAAAQAAMDAAQAKLQGATAALIDAQKQAVDARQDIQAAGDALLAAQAAQEALKKNAEEGLGGTPPSVPGSPEEAELAAHLAGVDAQATKAKEYAQALMSKAYAAKQAGAPGWEGMMMEAEAAQRVAAEKNQEAKALRQQLEAMQRTK